MSDQDYPDGIAAVGIIEATGFVPIFDAVDSMTKAAEIVVCSVNKIGAHLVACIVEGELAAVRVALDVGEESARAVGATDVRTVVFASPSEPIAVLAESAPTLLGAR